ncbi:MAG: glycosyltransferase family 4 protein [Candidatus Omnitrophica bacterium]|nr:glycosyltransferase family 4 protein [Candidatus Omnitrophota bacterium]
MKIAWFHSHLLNWSGGTKFLYETLKRLNERVDITIFVEAADEKLQAIFEESGIKVVAFTRTRSSKSHTYWLFFPFFIVQEIFWVYRKVKNFDMYVSSFFPMNYVLFKAGKKPHIFFCFEPFVFIHDQDMINGFGLQKRLALHFLRFLYAKKDIRASRAADSILTLNADVAKSVTQTYNREPGLTYMGVDIDSFRHYPDTPYAQKYASKKVIIHSTDYTPLKRTWFLIQSMENIIKRVPNAVLLITHSQDDRREKQKMENYIHEHGLDQHVEFLEFLDYAVLPQYYSLADIAVYPGIGCGAAASSYFVLECMACETPCVRTNTTTEETADGVSGYLFDPYDSNDMEEKIIRLLTDKNLAVKMGKNARKTVLDRYNWNLVTNNFLQAFKKHLDFVRA